MEWRELGQLRMGGERERERRVGVVKKCRESERERIGGRGDNGRMRGTWKDEGDMEEGWHSRKREERKGPRKRRRHGDGGRVRS